MGTPAFYDDGHGDVPGVSPLNIASFFLQILGGSHNEVFNQDIPPLTLSAGGVQRNFYVSDFTITKDIVVVKEDPNALVQILTPNGQIAQGDR